MKQAVAARSSWRGYTIVEVMIFLAVSSALLISGLLVVSGQQQRTEFSQASRDIEQQIQDVINDVATGYYANTGNIHCTPDPANGPFITSGPDRQGANQGCVFLGRAIQFAVQGSNNQAFNVYNIVGLQKKGGGLQGPDVQNLVEAKPKVLRGSSVDTTDRRRLKYGLSAQRLRSASSNYGTIAFISTVDNNTAGTNQCGNQTTIGSIELCPIGNTSLNQAEASVINELSNPGSYQSTPSDGITICFDSGGTNERATIIIGGQGRRPVTELRIGSGDCP